MLGTQCLTGIGESLTGLGHREAAAQRLTKEPRHTAGLFAYPGAVNMACPDDHLTGAEAGRRFGLSRTWCNTARYYGRLVQQPCGHYRYRDVQKAEAEARKTGMVRSGRPERVAASLAA